MGGVSKTLNNAKAWGGGHIINTYGEVLQALVTGTPLGGTYLVLGTTQNVRVLLFHKEKQAFLLSEIFKSEYSLYQYQWG